MDQLGSQTIHFGTVFMAFFAIMNPVANAALFLGLTEELDQSLRRAIALRAVVTAFFIVAIFAVAGQIIFEVFAITLPAFRIAGGILIGLIGYHMLNGNSSPSHAPSDEDNTNSKDSALSIAITPLGIPVLAGPGTIATAMNFSAASSLENVLLTVGAFAAMCGVTFFAFLSSDPMTRFLGQNAIKVITRLMGLILAVIGTQMLIDGISEVATT